MKIVAHNHADTIRRAGSADTPGDLLLDTVGDELRARYSEAAADLPDALLALAARVDRERPRAA